MKKHRCLVCKYQGNHQFESVHVNTLFKRGGVPVEFHLCYSHSVEFFKSGQCSFFTKHKTKFDGQFGSDEDQKVMDFIKETETEKSALSKSNFF
jgi:hypothetical protein